MTYTWHNLATAACRGGGRDCEWYWLKNLTIALKLEARWHIMW